MLGYFLKALFGEAETKAHKRHIIGAYREAVKRLSKELVQYWRAFTNYCFWRVGTKIDFHEAGLGMKTRTTCLLIRFFQQTGVVLDGLGTTFAVESF